MLKHNVLVLQSLIASLNVLLSSCIKILVYYDHMNVVLMCLCAPQI